MTVKEAQEWLDKQECPEYFPIRGWLSRRARREKQSKKKGKA